MSESNSTPRSDASGPLAGVRVLELSTTVAGPFCGRLLGDFGAEVIKVEPRVGDEVRSMGRHAQGKSLYAASILRNKALAAIDLRTPGGQEAVRRLAGVCDVVVENFRPGRLEQWGLGYENLAAANPKLVLVRISGYGQDGPNRERPGYGVIMEAVGGLRHITGDTDRPPTRMAVSLTDYITGLYAAFGTVMAVRHAELTGEGQVIDAALYEGAFSFMEPHVPAYAALGAVAQRAGNHLPNNVPNNLYITGDEQYLLIAAPAQAPFRRLAECMGRPDLADDPRFATAAARVENEGALDDLIAAWTGSHPLEALEARLHEAAIPATSILSMADIFAHPHYRARGMLAEVSDEDLGHVTLAAPVPRLTGTPGRIRWAGRAIGADTRRVLMDIAGYNEAEVAALENDQAVYCGKSLQSADATSAGEQT